jgi:hypothetical protein
MVERTKAICKGQAVYVFSKFLMNPTPSMLNGCHLVLYTFE